MENDEYFQINDINSAMEFLKARRMEAGYLMSHVAEKANFHQTTFTRIEDKEEIPTLNRFLAYANVIGYTLYLVHENGNPIFPENEDEIANATSLIDFLKTKRKSKDNFTSLMVIAKDTGISHTTFMRMEKGETMPSLKNFLVYANALGYFVMLYPIRNNKLYKKR